MGRRGQAHHVTPERWNHNIHYHPLLLRAVPAGARRALDVGCGDGLFALRLAERVWWVEGIDESAEAIDAAKRNAGASPGVRFTVGDFMDARLEAPYDYVAAIASLHHMPFEDALRKMTQLVRPGGVLAILGLFQEQTRFDLAASLVALPVSRWHLRRRGAHDYPLPTANPTMTLSQIRRVAGGILPGALVRRHLLWRYSIVWIKPEQ